MTDPIQVLSQLWQDPELPLSQRVQAAVSVLPYEMGRLMPESEPESSGPRPEEKWAVVEAWIGWWRLRATDDEMPAVESAAERWRTHYVGPV